MSTLTHASTIAYHPLPCLYTLQPKDIPHYIALQDFVISCLPDDKKHFLKPQTPQNLHDHLHEGLPIIGVKDMQGNHIGHIRLAFAPPALLPTGEPSEHPTVLLQSLTVHPDYRPKKCHEGQLRPDQLLFKAALDFAKENGYDSITAKVSEHNQASLNLFKQNGFNVVETTQLPDEDYVSSLLMKEIDGVSPAFVAKPLAPQMTSAVS